MRTAILAVVVAIVAGHCPPGMAQGKDEPPVLPSEDPNAVWREHIELPGDPFLMHEIGSYTQRIRQLNLVQLGATTMTWEDDYKALAGLLVKVGEEFATTTGRDPFVLEMEYKKFAPGGGTATLVVKQVREVPQPDQTLSVTPFLLRAPAQYCVYHGEFGNVFANHRLKSRWQLETRSL